MSNCNLSPRASPYRGLFRLAGKARDCAIVPSSLERSERARWTARRNTKGPITSVHCILSRAVFVPYFWVTCVWTFLNYWVNILCENDGDSEKRQYSWFLTARIVLLLLFAFIWTVSLVRTARSALLLSFALRGTVSICLFGPFRTGCRCGKARDCAIGTVFVLCSELLIPWPFCSCFWHCSGRLISLLNPFKGWFP